MDEYQSGFTDGIFVPFPVWYCYLLSISSLLVTCELFHLHVAATNWNDLMSDIRDCSSVSVIGINLKVIFLALPILPSHVSPQRLRITFLLHMAFYKFFKMLYYCIVCCILCCCITVSY